MWSSFLFNSCLADILDSVIDSLLTMGIANATDIVIGGGSAGALAVYLHADHYNSRLNPTGEKTVVAVPDCGFFMDSNGYRSSRIENSPATGYHDGIAWLYSAEGQNAVVDSRCHAAHATTPELCLFAEHLVVLMMLIPAQMCA